MLNILKLEKDKDKLPLNTFSEAVDAFEDKSILDYTVFVECLEVVF